jgi:uncharacterized membrane protein
LMLVAGIIGLIAAAALTLEYINHLKNPHYVPVCNLNPVFSCSSVMTSSQAHAFGIPNELVGVAGYAAIAAIGAAILAGGIFKRRFWQLINFGLLLAVAFITWLQFETLYRIGALCIFCMITWVATLPLFWYVTLYNLKAENIALPRPLRRCAAFVIRHHADILLSWFLLIVILVLKRFWYFFGNL